MCSRSFLVNDVYIPFSGLDAGLRRVENSERHGTTYYSTRWHGRSDQLYSCTRRLAVFFVGWCRVGVNWQSEKRLSLEAPVMHRCATEARRTQRSALPVCFEVGEEEYESELQRGRAVDTERAYREDKKEKREGGRVEDRGGKIK